jgi:hypothetical protein
MELHVLRLHGYKKVAFGVPSVWCMDVRLASARTVGRIAFICGTQGFVHPRLVTGESEHSGSKNKRPWNGPQNTKWVGAQNPKCQFSRNHLYLSDGFNCCSVFCNQQWSTGQQSISFQGNVVKVNRIRESMCDDLAPIFGLLILKK